MRLGEPVRSVVQDGEGVTVHTGAGAAYRAGVAVVALPPLLAESLDLRPVR